MTMKRLPILVWFMVVPVWARANEHLPRSVRMVMGPVKGGEVRGPQPNLPQRPLPLVSMASTSSLSLRRVPSTSRAISALRN
jgi:hypothetical protein